MVLLLQGGGPTLLPAVVAVAVVTWGIYSDFEYDWTLFLQKSA
jgi:hypothetical protein